MMTILTMMTDDNDDDDNDVDDDGDNDKDVGLHLPRQNILSCAIFKCLTAMTRCMKIILLERGW